MIKNNLKWLYAIVAGALLLPAPGLWAHITGTVWLDSNCNGILEGGESGVSGVTVNVYFSQTDCSSLALVATATTAGNGTFAITTVPGPGYYQVCFTGLPAGATISPIPSSPPAGATVTTVGPNGCTGCFFWDTLTDITENAGICPAPCAGTTACIPSNFNGTSIAAGNWIWFNSVIKVSGRNNQPATIVFDGSTVTASAGTVNVPSAIIKFDASATTASTAFVGGTWVTTVPVAYTGNVFLSGIGVQLPAVLPGGLNPVTWCGNFSSDTQGLSVQWQWAAAVYTSPCASASLGNLAVLGVKPVDANNLSAYLNSDHAGTPETVKTCVIGGARGGGGSNFTGSYSGTGSAKLCVQED